MWMRVSIVIILALLVAGCDLNTGSSARKTKVKKSSTQTSVTSSVSPSLTQQEVIANTEASTVHITGRVGSGYVFGTGVVIDETKGWILTNAHVISGTSTLTVTLPDHTQPNARVIGQAPCEDIAVLEINQNPGGLQAIPFGEDQSVEQGDDVTAVGYPESFQDPFSADVKPTSTTGTVSTTGISAEPDESLPRYESLIQHQAFLNHGNSGGPLVDDQGRLIGINTLVNDMRPSGEPIQGQFYAISIDAIKQLLPRLETGENVGYVGWSLMANSPELAAQFAEVYGSQPPTSDGLLALGSDPGTPAYKHAIQAGDVIERVDGSPVSTVAELCAIVQSHGPGDVLTVDGESIDNGGSPYTWSEDIKLP